MLKQGAGCLHSDFDDQPPSGGCVLKLRILGIGFFIRSQPPSGGCVLKLNMELLAVSVLFQPPSGGCVLKPLVEATEN